jgi:hypothetical protein
MLLEEGVLWVSLEQIVSTFLWQQPPYLELQSQVQHWSSFINPTFIPILCVALVAARKLPLFHFSNICLSPFATNSRDSSHMAPTHPLGVTVTISATNVLRTVKECNLNRQTRKHCIIYAGSMICIKPWVSVWQPAVWKLKTLLGRAYKVFSFRLLLILVLSLLLEHVFSNKFVPWHKGFYGLRFFFLCSSSKYYHHAR